MSNGINKEVARETMSSDPSQILEFFLIYYAWPTDTLNFIAITPIANFGKSITWQGVNYFPTSMEAKGFNIRGDGELVRPRLTISNAKLEISKYLKTYNNLIGAKVIRKRTFAKFLDDVNFAGGKNPYFDLRTQTSTADIDSYLPDQVYYIYRRVAENKFVVEFELSSVLEVENVFVPNRNVYSRYCTWIYRGQGCGFLGTPKTTSNSQSFKTAEGDVVTPTTNMGVWSSATTYNKGEFAFVETDNYLMRDDIDLDSRSTEKLKTFYVCIKDSTAGNLNFPPISKNWQRDECAKKISDCKLRFGSNSSNILPFGGFPGCHEYPPNMGGSTR